VKRPEACSPCARRQHLQDELLGMARLKMGRETTCGWALQMSSRTTFCLTGLQAPNHVFGARHAAFVCPPIFSTIALQQRPPPTTAISPGPRRPLSTGGASANRFWRIARKADHIPFEPSNSRVSGF